MAKEHLWHVFIFCFQFLPKYEEMLHMFQIWHFPSKLNLHTATGYKVPTTKVNVYLSKVKFPVKTNKGITKHDVPYMNYSLLGNYAVYGALSKRDYVHMKILT